MALATYSDLKTSIANWLNRTDLTTEIAEDFIVLAISVVRSVLFNQFAIDVFKSE